MKKHLKYAKYLFFHKLYVFQEGWKRGLRLRVIVHDWDKFLPGRWVAYANFFGVPEDQRTPEVKEAFRSSWRRHAFMNDHHWQHWIAMADNGTFRPQEMTEKARVEMLADWLGAHRATGGSDLMAWYLARDFKNLLHPATRKWLEKELSKL